MGRPAAALVLLLALLPAAAISARLRRRLTHAKLNVDFKLRLNNFNNVQYSGDFLAGAQRLPVIYDTGSFEILVLSTLCGAKCTKGHTAYDQRKSSSFVASKGVIAEHLFGSGPVVSEKGFETVRVGGADSPYTVRRMPFWQVVQHGIEVWNEHARFSGIVGLGHPKFIPEGFGAEAGAHGDSADETLLSLLGVNSFALCLERWGSHAPGWLALGPSVQAQTATTGFHDLAVVGQVHWGVRLTEVSLPGLSIENPCKPSCGAIVDSGTSFIAVPPSATRMVKALSAKIAWDCSNLHSLPVLRFRLGGLDVELPPQAYVMQVQRAAAPNSTLWNSLFSDSKGKASSQCTAAFMTLDKHSQHGPVWILGMPFLRYYYTVFDRSAKRIRIARSSPTCKPLPLRPLAMPMLSNVTAGFFNASRLGAGTGGGLGSSAFAAADYRPLEVDLSAARFPEWATAAAGGEGSSREMLM